MGSMAAEIGVNERSRGRRSRSRLLHSSATAGGALDVSFSPTGTLVRATVPLHNPELDAGNSRC